MLLAKNAAVQKNYPGEFAQRLSALLTHALQALNNQGLRLRYDRWHLTMHGGFL
jgi:hypothetical protein